MHLILIVGIKYNIILKMTIHNISQAVFIRRLLNIFLCMSQIGSNAVYILFVAQNILPVIWRLFCPEYLVGDRNILVQNILLIITIYPCSLTQSEITLFLKIVESHLDPGWNYRIYIGLLIIPVLAICRLS